MKYRRLGKTELKISAVGIETHQWSGMGGKDYSEEGVKEIIDHSLELGFNFIDTGIYRSHKAEELIGKALVGRRDKFVIATKFGFPGDDVGEEKKWSASEIKKEIEESLKALKTDYVDVYQIHINSLSDQKEFIESIDEIKTVLEKAKTSGEIRFIGICLGDNKLFDASGDLLKKALEKIDISVVQTVYNRLDKEAEENIMPIIKKLDLGFIARVPLAKGYLSSRFKPQKDFDKKRIKEVEDIKKSELPSSVDLAEWAIAWPLKKDIVTTVVPGHSTPEQLDSTARAVELI